MIYPRILLGDLDLTAAPFLWEFGSDFGGPEVVYETLLSMLRDGSSVSSTRVDNRTMTLPVMIEAADFVSLAEYEAQLVAECDKPRNTLTFEPGDAFGPPTVFQTFRASATLQRSDEEEQAFVRRWSVTIPALPWPRSADLTVTPAQPTTPTYTLVDNGSSAAGWSGSAMGATVTGPTVVSGKVTLTVATGGTHTVLTLTRTGAVDYSAARYIAVDWASSAPPAARSVILGSTSPGGGGVGLALTAWVDLGGGLTRDFYAVPTGTGSVSILNLQVNGDWPVGGTIAIDQVQTADAVPFFGTARQRALSFIPGGSVRPQGSIAVEHASSALGQVIVYTHPTGTGYLPPLRPRLLSSATVTADASLVSGARNAIGTTTTIYQIPVANLPQGRAEVWAWLRATSGAAVKSIDWAIASYMGTSLLDYDLRSAQINFPVNNTWYLVPLGAAAMPPVQLGPAGYVQVHLHQGAADVQVDEAYLFATDLGAMTVVDCGTGSPAAGGPSNRLWIDAPSLDQPQGAIFRGNAADRSDAWAAGSSVVVRPPFGHNLAPEGINVFVVTPNATDAATSSTHYKRWHTNAAE